MFETAGFTCRFVRPPPGFANPNVGMAVGRLGQEVGLTTIERTIADLSDRYVLAGGAEELFNSLDLAVWIGAPAPVRYVRALAHGRRRGLPARARAEAAGRPGCCA